MNKALYFVLTLTLISLFLSPTAVHAVTSPPDNPWLSEVIDGRDINVQVSMSMTRLPGTDRLAVAYMGKRASLGYNILKFALQVPEGTGNCGEFKEWTCMDLDTSKNVGLNNSIAAVEDPYVEGIIIIGISYWDEENGNLKYAYREYEKSTGTLLRNWIITIVDGRGGNISQAGRKSSLTFDPKTGIPVIAYNSSDNAGPGANKYLNTATVAEMFQGNCGGVMNPWECVQITGEPIGNVDSLEQIGVGWIDQNLYYFYKSQYGLDYATYGPSLSACWNPNYYCARIDDSNTGVGYELRVSSWSGNVPGSPGYTSTIRENGVNLVYLDLTNNIIKFATTPKKGSLFQINAVADPESTNPLKSLSVTTDPNYYPAITFSRPSYYGNDLVIARPAVLYGLM